MLGLGGEGDCAVSRELLIRVCSHARWSSDGID